MQILPKKFRERIHLQVTDHESIIIRLTTISDSLLVDIYSCEFVNLSMLIYHIFSFLLLMYHNKTITKNSWILYEFYQYWALKY